MDQDGAVCYQPISGCDKERQRIYQARLCEMRSKLPAVFRSELADTSLAELATALLDGTVFEIVGELEEIQQLNERSLLSRRMRVVGEHKSRRMEMSRRHRNESTACRNKPHNIPLVTTRHKKEKEQLENQLKKELRAVDQKMILELDQIVTEQQSTLQQAAVPFFSVTSDPHEIQLQMFLLEFIQRLACDR